MKIRKSLGVIFSFLLSAVFLYIAFHGIRVRDVLTEISRASWGWVLLLAFSLSFAHFIRAIRWKIILRSVKQDTSLTNLYGALMIGYGVSNIIPRLGELSRPMLLGKWESISRTSLIGTVIMERVIDTIALSIAVLISVFIYQGDLYQSFPWLRSAMYLVAFAIMLFIIFIILLFRFKERFCNIIVKIAGRFSPKLSEKLSYIFSMLIQGFSTLKDIKSYIYTIALTAVITLLYGFNSYIGFNTLGMQNLKEVTFGMAWVLYCISSFGILIPTPGGTGSYQAITATAIVLLFGFTPELSQAYATLNWAVSYIVTIALAAVFFIFLNHKYKNLGKSESLADLLETNTDLK